MKIVKFTRGNGTSFYAIERRILFFFRVYLYTGMLEYTWLSSPYAADEFDTLKECAVRLKEFRKWKSRYKYKKEYVDMTNIEKLIYDVEDK